MKSTIFIAGFIFLGFLLSSCDPSTNIDNSITNYWERNALTRLQLKGKVKTLTTDNGSRTTQFNETGFITSITNTDGVYSSVATYTYTANGQLSTIVTVNINPTSGNATSTQNFEYDTHGKYIPGSVMHMYETGLTPNLKAQISEWGRTDYVFNGDNLLIISTSQSAVGVTKDTAIVKFSGKYPAGSTTDWSFAKDITYADNGMFLTYTEGFHGPEYTNSRIYKYKADDEFLLLESVNYIDVYGTQTTTSTQTFTYNDHKNLIKKVDGEGVQDYSDYVYDAQGNWTSRTYSYQYPGSQTTSSTETRTIVYWTDSKTSN
ncbi:MAG: hypothetical protein PHS84_07740 [Paludibacter sp.]|nr:hypothetical protein [Paludibacter sp.]